MSKLLCKVLTFFGLLLCILVTSAAAKEVTDNAASNCIALAGFPYLPNTNDPGVAEQDIDYSAALTACSKAVFEAPKNGYLSFLAARVYASNGEFVKANEGFLYSSDLNYGGGYFGLADVLIRSDPDFNPETVLGLWEKASDLGFWPADAKLADFMLDDGKYIEAYELLDDAIESSYPAALVIASQILLLASETPDLDNVESLLGRAAKSGYAPGLYDLARFYLQYRDDTQAALPYLNQLSEMGNARAKLILAMNYLKGNGIEQDLETGKKYLVESATLGLSDAQTILGRAYLDGDHGFVENENAGNQWLIAAANQGNTLALTNLGMRLNRGDRIDQDSHKAIEYLTVSAELGDQIAADYLSSIYYWGGNGIERDYYKALEYFLPSALDGESESLYYVASIYADQNNDPTDPEKAIEYYLQADRAVDGADDFLYGVWGEAESPNVHSAIALLEQCFKIKSDPVCAKVLGDIYQDPYLSTVDHSKAVHWLEIASKAEHIPALIALSQTYSVGKGVEQDLVRARGYLDRAEKVFQASDAQIPQDQIILYRAQGELEAQFGNYIRAEERYQKLLLGENSQYSLDQVSFLTDLNRLASVYLQQGRPEAALRFYDKLAELESQLDYSPPGLKFIPQFQRSVAYTALNETARARAILNQLLADDDLIPSFKELASGEGIVYFLLGVSYAALDDFSEAVDWLSKSLPMMEEAFGEYSVLVLQLKASLALALGGTGDFHAAEKSLTAVIETAERLEVVDRVQFLYAKAQLASFRRELGRNESAASLINEAFDELRHLLRSPQIVLSLGSVQAKNSAKEVLGNYIDIASHTWGKTDDKSSELAFEAAQETNTLSVIQPIHQRIAISKISDSGVKADIRNLQRLGEQWYALKAQFRETLTSDREGAENLFLDRRLKSIEDEIGDLSANLIKLGHDPYGIEANAPLSVSQVKNFLAPNEALIKYMVAKDSTYVWVVSREAFKAFAVDVNKQELRENLDRISRSVDLSRGLVPDFATDSAFTLFSQLIQRSLPELKGVNKLIIVPDGPLVGLPFSALVTDNAKDDSWLINDFTVSIIPSVGSLGLLRGALTSSKANKPFLGVGDPILIGTSSKSLSRSASIRSFYDINGEANLNAINRLPRLPESGTELRQIGNYLGAAPEDILVANKATENQVKGLALEDYRVIAFATHGLLGGEISALREPALVLTPPDEVTPYNDGLLTASEIGELQLDADLVVLSACNTASSNADEDATGLSGLARAFFLAGARNILVSNWYIESNSAASLTTQLFKRHVEDPSLTYAEALRLAMLDIQQESDNPMAAHPAYWAPFSIIGL